MPTNGQSALARTADEPLRLQKSEAAFRTISEVAEDLDVAQHVLRFWESKFPQVRPLKRGGGRRYYRPEDVGLLRQIRSLLYDEGYTIKGAQKLLRVKRTRGAEPAPSPPVASGPRPAPALVPSATPTAPLDVPAGVRGELVSLRATLVSVRERLRQVMVADELG